MADYACTHIRCELYGTCQFEADDSLITELDAADRAIHMCGARHDTADLTGLACSLREDHEGDHEGWMSVTWPREEKA